MIDSGLVTSDVKRSDARTGSKPIERPLTFRNSDVGDTHELVIDLAAKPHRPVRLGPGSAVAATSLGALKLRPANRATLLVTVCVKLFGRVGVNRVGAVKFSEEHRSLSLPSKWILVAISS